MQTLMQDLRYGLRLLKKGPVFAVAAILSLAIGIGASTAIFSLVNESIFRTLPAAIEDPDSLVRLKTRDPKLPSLMGNFPYQGYLNYKDENPVFSDILAFYSGGRFICQSGNRTDLVRGAYVSGNFFSLLGVHPALGRNLTPEDDSVSSGGTVAIISYQLWKMAFESDPLVAGKEIWLNRTSFTIIGVAPERFTGRQLGNVSIYVPFAALSQLEPKAYRSMEPNPFIELIARLKPGVSLNQAQTAMQAWVKQLYLSSPNLHKDRDAWVTPASQEGAAEFSQKTQLIAAMMAFIALVLLISCANVASLLLSRAIDRRREIALRAALGAVRNRIVRQLLTEALLLGLLGGAAGLLFAEWTINMLAAKVPLSFPFPVTLSMDARVLGFSLALSVFTSLLFGAIPALHMMRIDLASALGDLERQKLRLFHRFGARNLLVVGNIVFAMVVLIMAGRILQGVELSSKSDYGINPDNLLRVHLYINQNYYSKSRAQQFNRALLARLNTLPGIDMVGMAGSKVGTSYLISGKSSLPSSYNSQDYFPVGQGYFKMLNIPVIRGREFSKSAFQSQTNEVVINETMAQKLWPNQEALGQIIQGQYTVVGIVNDKLFYKFVFDEGSTPTPLAYLPLSEDYLREMNLYVRTADNAKSLAPAIRQLIRELDPGLPMTGMQTLSEWIETSLRQDRFQAKLLFVLGLLALGLASMGLYGVVSCTVGRRTREIGIRIAVGAQHAAVLRQLIAEGLQLMISALAIGLFLSWAVARVWQNDSTLVKASNPLVYIAVSLLLIFIALVACYLPARRALNANPMTALRSE
jgi:predicted permease